MQLTFVGRSLDFLSVLIVYLNRKKKVDIFFCEDNQTQWLFKHKQKKNLC